MTWLGCRSASQCVVPSSSRRVFRSYLHVLSRNRCNVAAFMPEAAGFHGVSDRAALQEFSVSSSESIWAAAARHRLSWIRPFRAVLDCDLSRGKIKWFEGGKLNVSGKITLSLIIEEKWSLEQTDSFTQRLAGILFPPCRQFSCRFFRNTLKCNRTRDREGIILQTSH